MRLLLGVILGVLLTIGGAYVYDSTHERPTATTVAQRPLVNWDVVHTKWNGLTTRAHAEWARITG